MSSGIKRCAFGRQCVITQYPFSASLWLWQRPTHKQPSESVRTEIAPREANLALQFPSCPLVRRNANPPDGAHSMIGLRC
jgi:hypothetical protein